MGPCTAGFQEQHLVAGIAAQPVRQDTTRRTGSNNYVVKFFIVHETTVR